MIAPAATRRHVLIVDDEPLARRGLRQLLAARGDVEVVGECDNGLAALELIGRHPRALVLLDVQMPGLDGLEVVRRLGPHVVPLIIFVTAYDTFAISAFELAAVDYVVKPFSDERLLRAVDRALLRRDEQTAARTLIRLAQLVDRETANRRLAAVREVRHLPGGSPPFRERFLVSIGTKDAVIHTSEISWIRASGYYASLVTHDRREYLVRLPLDQLDGELDPQAFIRVHRSAIVCLTEVRGLERIASTATVVVLRNGARVPVSRSRREALLRALGGAGA